MVSIAASLDVWVVVAHFLPLEPELRMRELSRAGGTKGSTTPDTRQDRVMARAARLSGRGRCAEKRRIEGRAS